MDHEDAVSLLNECYGMDDAQIAEWRAEDTVEPKSFDEVMAFLLLFYELGEEDYDYEPESDEEIDLVWKFDEDTDYKFIELCP